MCHSKNQLICRGKLLGKHSMLVKAEKFLPRMEFFLANLKYIWRKLNCLKSKIEAPIPWGIILSSHRIITILQFLAWRSCKMIYCSQGETIIPKDLSGPSKYTINTINLTKGLPKESDFYGNRASYSTCLVNSRYMRRNGRRKGRGAESIKIQYRGYCSVQNANVIERLEKIAEISSKNPNAIIDRNLYNLLVYKDLFILAYNKLKSRPGNMTPALDEATLDSFSEETVEAIIDKFKKKQFEFKPSRRSYIPKANGKLRLLTIASPKDKIVLEPNNSYVYEGDDLNLFFARKCYSRRWVTWDSKILFGRRLFVENI